MVSATMSLGSSNGSAKPTQDYENGLTSSVDLAFPQAISGVVLFLALMGVLIAIYLATVDRAVGAAALSMVLAGISLSVSLTYLGMTSAPPNLPSFNRVYLDSFLPAPVPLTPPTLTNGRAPTSVEAR